MGPISVNYAACFLDVPRQFTTDDIGTAGLARGWQLPTITGLVNNEPEAVMDLLLQHIPTSCRLEVSGHPICRSGDKVGIECFANGRWIGYWHADAEKNITIVADIEPEIFHSVPPTSYLRIVWHFTCWRDAKRKMEDGYFKFESITIKRRPESAIPIAPTENGKPVALWSAPPRIEEFATDPGISLLCMEGMALPEISEDWYTFHLPKSLEEVVLCSHSSIPSEIGTAADERQLGIAVAEITVGNRHIPLGHWSLRDGWHSVEESWRWTNGAARLLLPAKSTELRIRIAAVLPKYRIFCD